MSRSLTFRLILLGFFALPSGAAACPKIDGLEDVNCDGKLTIVTFGDSITYGRGDEVFSNNAKHRGYPGRMRPYFPQAVIINLGLPGENSAQGAVRAKKIFRTLRAADYVIILEGINDFSIEPHSAVRTRDNLSDIGDAAALTGAIVLLSSLTPVTDEKRMPWVTSVNKKLRQIALVNFNSVSPSLISPRDHVHPDDQGYAEMAKIAAEALFKVSNELSLGPTDK